VAWFPTIVIAAAGIASMRAAMERGDIDEASRQGVLAGPAIVEEALAAPDRTSQLAAIAAAPAVEDRAELLEALATVAAGPDRRTAIPAARAARTIARELTQTELPDDLTGDDLVRWRDQWGTIARAPDRWIDVRVLALDVAAALDRGTGIPLDASLADPDPAFRRAALAVIPVPTPPALRPLLAKAIVSDTSPVVALAAAQALCADLVADPPGPILAALGAPGLTRLRTIITTPGVSGGTLRDAARCLAADKSPASAAALRAVRLRLR
jgi:hypothetical protein